MKKFWTVWRSGGGTPTKAHETKPAAVKEATRLATDNPGVNFFVMEAAGYVVAEISPAEFTALTKTPKTS